MDHNPAPSFDIVLQSPSPVATIMRLSLDHKAQTMNWHWILIVGVHVCCNTVSASDAIEDWGVWNPTPAQQVERIDQSPVSVSAIYEDRSFGKQIHLTNSHENSLFEIRHSEHYSPFRLTDPEDGPEQYSSRLSLTQGTSWGWLHFSSITGHAEHQRYTGVTLGKTTLMYANGEGQTYLSTENAYGGVNPFLFHGGNRLPYSFSGFSVTQAVTDQVETTLAATRVRSPGVDDRLGISAGVSMRAFSGSLVEVQRDNQTASRGFDIGFAAHRFRGFIRQLTSTNGASYKSVVFGWDTQHGATLGLNLARSVNPLYRDAEDTRLMVTFSGTWGGSKNPVLYQNDADQTEQPKKYPQALLIGGGLAAAALIATSGSSSKDEANRLPAQHDAAFVALNGINPTSVRENREYGGWVYRNADGSFAHTGPVRGAPAGVDIGPPGAVPAGTTATATYHTHAAFDPRFDNENFSPQDILANRVFQVDGYLGTPAGLMKYYNVRAGEISTIREIAN